MALVEDGALLGSRQLDMGNSGWRLGREAESAVSWTFPEWAKWTGDPFYDLYSHIEPGAVGHYSSAGFWRLGQTLTVLWGRDLKDVLDERIFSPNPPKDGLWDSP